MFEASIDEHILAEQRKKSFQAAAMMKAMPDSQKKLIAEHSYIWGTHFYEKGPAGYLSGMGTYMLKLGPQLIGGGDERKIDRAASMGVSGIAARMRMRDLCLYQNKALSSVLKTHPVKCLRLINIAGGAASDTINTLRLIQKMDASLLQNRRIEIHLLEIDELSAHFAEKSLHTLQMPGADFDKLELIFRFYHKSWTDKDAWRDILKDSAEDIILCSSEGGLFEYGSDEDIHLVLRILADQPYLAIEFTGSCLLDRETVDPTITAMAETSGASLRFLGKDGLENMLKPSAWAVDWISQSSNPVYVLFSLRRQSPQNK